MNRYTKLFCLMIGLLSFLPACIRQVHITSNTFANANSIPYGFPLGSRFAIICTSNENRLFAQEVTAKISKILYENGYEVSDENNADYYLTFHFGMTSSRATKMVPVIVPGTSETTHGIVAGNRDFIQYNERTQSPDTLTYVPHEYTLFTRELHLTASDAHLFRRTHQEEQIWQGSAISSGESGDLREVMDYLLKASFKNFGRNTKRSIQEVYTVR